MFNSTFTFHTYFLYNRTYTGKKNATNFIRLYFYFDNMYAFECHCLYGTEKTKCMKTMKSIVLLCCVHDSRNYVELKWDKELIFVVLL